MRINLVTPFAEKDAAKALGARWDAAKKCWYIVDIADLTPFLRWIPDMNAAMEMSGHPPRTTMPKASMTTPAKAPVKSIHDVTDCGCNVLPWEDCKHTIKSEVQS